MPATASAAAPVRAGHVIVSLLEAKPGHERAFHHWYERDHLYSVGAAAPGVLSTRLWLAPRRLRALRLPAGPPQAPNPVCGALGRGTHCATLWIEAGREAEHAAWVDAEMERQRTAGRLFAQREHLYTHRYALRGAVARDAAAPPLLLAHDRGHPGMVATWIEVGAGVASDAAAHGAHGSGGTGDAGDAALAALDARLRETLLPERLRGSPVALAAVLALVPPAAAALAVLPQAAARARRLLVLHWLDCDPEDVFEDLFGDFADALAAQAGAQLLLAAPFVANVPGADPVL